MGRRYSVLLFNSVCKKQGEDGELSFAEGGFSCAVDFEQISLPFSEKITKLPFVKQIFVRQISPKERYQQF